ncbi:MAG: 4'-phosphopantetheinyl transferase superfamily protein [Bacteroidota bacterium]
MIGNDIVDLAYARQMSNWQRPRFLDKVFSATEQHMIKEAEDPERWVWLLWSIKESVYKLIHRNMQRSFFAPKRIECVAVTPTITNEAVKFVVHYEDQTYFGESQLDQAYLHSIAYAANKNPDYSAASFSLEQCDYTHQQAFIRRELLRQYAKTEDLAVERLSIQKNISGIPAIYLGGVQQDTVLSISHHGYFAAYAFIK